jgi:hypothetical protein
VNSLENFAIYPVENLGFIGETVVIKETKQAHHFQT